MADVPVAGAPTAAHVARLNARVSAYLIDSVVLLGFVLVFFVIAGLVLLLASDLGKQDAPDSAYYAFMGIFLGGSLLVWSAFNVTLMRWRGQSAGMYVIGIRTVTEDSSAVTIGRALLRWFGLHPLLFHPLLLPIWFIFSLLAVSLTLSQSVFVITLALVLLCIVSPLAGLATMSLDAERRALHDRLAGTLVVHLD